MSNKSCPWVTHYIKQFILDIQYYISGFLWNNFCTPIVNGRIYYITSLHHISLSFSLALSLSLLIACLSTLMLSVKVSSILASRLSILLSSAVLHSSPLELRPLSHNNLLQNCPKKYPYTLHVQVYSPFHTRNFKEFLSNFVKIDKEMFLK